MPASGRLARNQDYDTSDLGRKRTWR